jgi:hypothetical protein
MESLGKKPRRNLAEGVANGILELQVSKEHVLEAHAPIVDVLRERYAQSHEWVIVLEVRLVRVLRMFSQSVTQLMHRRGADP